MSPNQRESIGAVSSITGKFEYLYSTNHVLNSTATITGSSIPITGATTGVGVAILDGSGNQITSFGGGTQYADGAARGTATGTLGMVDDGTLIQSAAGDANGNQKIVGSIASGASDSGNPVKVGGIYNSSTPTFTNGQRGDLQLDASGNLKITGSFTAASDLAPATQNITVVDSGSSSAAGANNQTIIIGTPTAGSAASFALSTIETVRVEVTGIWTGTIATETSIDGGTTWVNQGVHQGAYTVSTFTAGFVGGCNVAGATNFRIRATAAITGTVVVKVTESVNTQSVYIANAAPSGNIVSVLNSSTATLTSGSVYTGTAEDMSNFAEIRVSVFSNVASATDGLSLQQSPDATNWDVVDTYTIAAATAGQGKTFVIPRQERWFRVVYTNGGTNQATFRLQTILDRAPTAPSSNRASDAYTNETDLVQNQTFNMLYNGTTWDRVRGDITNGIDVDVTRLPSLVAGAAIIGKVGIDQTTPGTTNLVALSAETTKVIGTVNQGTSPWVTSNATTSVVGNGAAATAQRVTLANDSTGVLATVSTVTTVTTLTGTTTLTPGTGAANLGKAEDAAHASGDTGVFALAVRNDNLATTYGADQDYAPIAVDLNSRVMVAQKAATATLSNVAASASSVTVLAANSARIGAQVSNDSSAVLYLKFGTTASTTSYVVSLAGAASAPFSYYEVPAGYTGRIDGISASATGNYRVTEET